MNDWILVDTCVWALFFGKPGSLEKAVIDSLIDSDRVVLIGPIIAEILVGFRRRDQADWVVLRLRMAHYFEAGWDDWRTAADLGRDLAGKGHKLPLTDLVIAAVSMRCNVSVYTTDPHFDLIPELKRYQPNASSGQ